MSTQHGAGSSLSSVYPHCPEPTSALLSLYHSAPIGVFVFIVAMISIPNGFPNRGREAQKTKEISFKMIGAKIDLPGSILLIMASLCFTACFQEADTRFSWNSAYVITLLVLSVALWMCLMLWERHITLANSITEPVLPWRLFTNRAVAGLFL